MINNDLPKAVRDALRKYAYKTEQCLAELLKDTQRVDSERCWVFWRRATLHHVMSDGYIVEDYE